MNRGRIKEKELEVASIAMKLCAGNFGKDLRSFESHCVEVY